MDERQIVIAGVYIGLFFYLYSLLLCLLWRVASRILRRLLAFAWNLLASALAHAWTNPRSILIATMHLTTVLNLSMLLGYTPYTFERLKVLVCIGMSCHFINVGCVIGSELPNVMCTIPDDPVLDQWRLVHASPAFHDDELHPGK